eukprot:TRINITY_DN5071_c0_g2_i3.p1 TRINITY_DN5071_c0_g2~~TRINITY_DN5071_c0_g2_i3.p1  ORF type:complete len:454 (-),score=43.65 TRINITY_DN5071_c0_g2_i3:1589-2950(-)
MQQETLVRLFVTGNAPTVAMSEITKLMKEADTPTIAAQKVKMNLEGLPRTISRRLGWHSKNYLLSLVGDICRGAQLSVVDSDDSQLCSLQTSLCCMARLISERKLQPNFCGSISQMLCSTIPVLGGNHSPVIQQLMSVFDAKCRCSALELLSSCSPSVVSRQKVSDILYAFTSDRDWRVRQCAVQYLTGVHRADATASWPCMKVPRGVFSILNDLSDVVRARALDLLAVHQAHCKSSAEEASATFDVLCSMVREPHEQMRAYAANLLGSFFPELSSAQIDQTLAQERVEINWETADEARKLEGKAPMHTTGSNLASRKRLLGLDLLVAPTPKHNSPTLPQQEIETTRDTFTTGAFAQLLEDELQTVRIAALESMARLSAAFPRFGSLAVDFLFDMFNDEAEIVREVASKALRHLGQHLSPALTLNGAQLAVALHGLEDKSVKVSVKCSLVRFE